MALFGFVRRSSTLLGRCLPSRLPISHVRALSFVPVDDLISGLTEEQIQVSIKRAFEPHFEVQLYISTNTYMYIIMYINIISIHFLVPRHHSQVLWCRVSSACRPDWPGERVWPVQGVLAEAGRSGHARNHCTRYTVELVFGDKYLGYSYAGTAYWQWYSMM